MGLVSSIENEEANYKRQIKELQKTIEEYEY